MPTILKIVDETIGGDCLDELSIPITSDQMTVKDIITLRVEEEVRKYNHRVPEYFKGLVQPTESEQTLNGYKTKQQKPVDAEKQVYVALDAYQKNGYFVFVNDRQAEDLQEEVVINENTRVSFVKLTPLVGG